MILKRVMILTFKKQKSLTVRNVALRFGLEAYLISKKLRYYCSTEF